MEQHVVPVEPRITVLDAQNLAMHNARSYPVADTINIEKSPGVHIGPKIVSVVQNIDNDEKVKGRFLGLELVSKMNRSRRCRCSIAVFLCWAVVVGIGLIIYLVHALKYSQPTRLDIGLNATWYLRRDEWLALPPYSMEFLNLPVDNVVIGHSAVGYCNQRYKCIAKVLSIQEENLRRGLQDIAANFLVGGNGNVFEGRGANVLGAVLPGWNSKSISILFMGNYGRNDPVDEQFINVEKLLEVLVNENVLIENYQLIAHCQITQSLSPGAKVIDRLNEFSHWNPVNVSTCLRD